MILRNQILPRDLRRYTTAQYLTLFGKFVGLLNEFPGAAAAYSLRRLGSYSGPVVEVRRSSDSDTESFTESQIISGAMLDFVNLGTTNLYNSARYLDGAGAQVDLASSVTMVGDFQISFSLLFMSIGVTQYLLTENDIVDNRLGVSGATGQFFLNLGSTSTFTGAIPVEGTNTVELNRVGSTVTLVLNSVEYTVTQTGNFDVKQFGFGVMEGSLFDINLNNQAAYTGLGTSVTAWEDTIGSNDGTESNGAAYTGQPFDGFDSAQDDQSGVTIRNATQATTTEQPKIVDAGAVVLDGNGNASTVWDGIDDDLDVLTGFAGLTSANVYAVTDNAGVVTLDTLTAQNISAATNLSTILTSLTYDKVTAVIIYPDATDQAGIESFINDLYGT